MAAHCLMKKGKKKCITTTVGSWLTMRAGSFWKCIPRIQESDILYYKKKLLHWLMSLSQSF